MIEVKETVEPFVPPAETPKEPETDPTETVNVEVMTVVRPVEPRSVTAVEEEEDEEEVVSHEVRQAAYELPAYGEYLREQRGDSLTYGDW